jgi:hypothetical protein
VIPMVTSDSDSNLTGQANNPLAVHSELRFD